MCQIFIIIQFLTLQYFKSLFFSLKKEFILSKYIETQKKSKYFFDRCKICERIEITIFEIIYVKFLSKKSFNNGDRERNSYNCI